MERFAKVNELLAEYESLEAQMADPSIHSDQNKARSLGKRYAHLGPVIAGYRAYKLAEDDFNAGKELAAADPEFAPSGVNSAIANNLITISIAFATLTSVAVILLIPSRYTSASVTLE